MMNDGCAVDHVMNFPRPSPSIFAYCRECRRPGNKPICSCEYKSVMCTAKRNLPKAADLASSIIEDQGQLYV